jgi:hypothetical protein
MLSGRSRATRLSAKPLGVIINKLKQGNYMKSIQEIVNGSGYPLQLLLEELIESDTQRRKWRVVAKEHRWVDNILKEEGYIDLILEKDGLNIRVVVECKRILGNWIFLIPQKLPENVQITKFLSVDYDTYNYLWSPLRISPESKESSFCIMETEGKKDSRTLEKYSNEILLSLESMAIEETELIKKRGEKVGYRKRKCSIYLLLLQLQYFNQ